MWRPPLLLHSERNAVGDTTGTELAELLDIRVQTHNVTHLAVRECFGRQVADALARDILHLRCE